MKSRSGWHFVGENQINAVMPEDVSGLVANPAAIGEYISVYLSGLGATENSGGLQVAKSRPEATVDGIAATVAWAGRAAGYVGLEQVNIVIPSGIRVGMQVPLTIKSGERVSNTTTLAVQQESLRPVALHSNRPQGEALLF